MNIKLNINDVKKFAQIISSTPLANDEHILNICEGTETIPVFYSSGEVYIEDNFEKIPLDESIGNFSFFVNSLDNELLDLLSLMYVGKWYKDVSAKEIEIIDRRFTQTHGLSAKSNIAERLVSLYGLFPKVSLTVLTDVQDQLVDRVFSEYYRDYQITEVALVNNEYILAALQSANHQKTVSHPIESLPSLLSKATNQIERDIQDLSQRLELMKELEKSLEKNIEVTVEQELNI